ncbi:TPR repeat-containing protein [Solidesulfovibrio fructosivorans JJ]]|uniref:TPR repeat-containing protein n=1 Tax=Solidesulfovibrio fructosivorans JJ] TaxID=596151 RepID=E1JS40_SOLFR|nr:tetratricopeptide repeat protein [Solidesulfovibrio fructosivorans]EFL52809.1 TPR repeat-containing protein [Solidesulfovibrio fructosivorans JJ]]
MEATSSSPSPQGHPKEELFRGVFSTQEQSVIGFGSTKRKVQQNIHVFAEEQKDGSYLLRVLNKHFIPSGKSRVVTKEELLSNYLPEPDLYMNKVLPMLRQVRETVDAADEHREQAEFMSAEFEYKNALRVDEEHIRATFGLGLTYLDRGEVDNANLVCRRIITLEAAFGEEHKHLFNEFGIKMRKHKMYAQALRYYFKAYRLTKRDENLLYNIARTYYEKGKFKLARKFLEMGLAINPAFEEGQGLLRAVSKKEAEENILGKRGRDDEFAEW